MDCSGAAQVAAYADPTSQPIHGGAHGIHADTAARQISDLRSRREARSEDYLDGINIAHPVEFVRRGNTSLASNTADCSGIDPTSVILHLHGNAVALAASPEHNPCPYRF